MRNVKLVISYDGTGFMGWQIQSGVRTVQETMEKALGEILGHPVRVKASGRTDAGVHAVGQVINFPTSSHIPPDGLLRGLNAILPGDVSVISAADAEPDFHSRYAARSKTYLYLMETAPTRSPFLDRYALHVRWPLDVPAMREAAGHLLGEHDFTSFMAAGSAVKTTVRTITAAELATRGSKLVFWIQGSGFLRYMVRNIVGTLLLVGRGKLSPQEMPLIMLRKDRGCAGPTAPPHGLYLIGVEY